MVARALVQDVVVDAWRTPARPRRLQWAAVADMSIDRAQTARGALAGAVAAAVWSAQSPLDIRVFGVSHHDEQLLGKAVTSGPAAHAVGVGLHLGNGALLGAAYANVAPRLPVAPWARGLLAGLAEHLATWPLTLVSDRYHPARDELPRLAGNPRAFAQATWRHLLFGAVLGELERRLNARGARPARSVEDVASSNGHGDLAAAVGVI